MKDSTELKAAIVQRKVRAFDFIISSRSSRPEELGYATKEDLAYGTIKQARAEIDKMIRDWEESQ